MATVNDIKNHFGNDGANMLRDILELEWRKIKSRCVPLINNNADEIQNKTALNLYYSNTGLNEYHR